jgi:ribonuclease HII
MINLLKHETELLGNGYKVICGVDEVGYGALAGPLVACAIVMDINRAKRIRIGRYKINDSKQLPKKIRKRLFRRILKSAEAVGIGIVDVPEINHIRNIDKSAYLARYRAVQNLGRSNNFHCHIYWHPKDQNLSYAMKFHILYTPIVPHYILVDGPYGMPEINDIPVKAIIAGDRKSISIASASIVAKVYKDTLMVNLSKLYPQYGWERNVGYSTDHHRRALDKYGITAYHRAYYEALEDIVNKMKTVLDDHDVQVSQVMEDQHQLRFEFAS